MAASGAVVWSDLRSLGRPDWVIQFKSDDPPSLVHTIGRHPSCSLVLPDMCISSKHVTITQRRSADGLREIWVEDLSSNGTWVNNEKLDKKTPTLLRSGAELGFPSEDDDRENYTFTFSELLEDGAPGFADEAGAIGAASGHLALTPKEIEYERVEKQQRKEDWEKLNELQMQLVEETSRLAASIYSNETLLLKHLDSRGDGSDKADKASQNLQDRSSKTYNNLVNIIQLMVSNMNSARDLANKLPSLSSNDRNKMVEALKVDRYERALDHLMSQGLTVSTDVELSTEVQIHSTDL